MHLSVTFMRILPVLFSVKSGGACKNRSAVIGKWNCRTNQVQLSSFYYHHHSGSVVALQNFVLELIRSGVIAVCRRLSYSRNWWVSMPCRVCMPRNFGWALCACVCLPVNETAAALVEG